MSKVVVLGAGQWGSTLAQVLCDAGNHVLLWGRNQDVVDEINNKHTNTYYLDDNALPFGLKATSNLQEAFDYSKVVVEGDFVQYKGILAKHIIFAEGFGLHANPYFNHLPLDGTKGELFIIKAPDLDLDVIVNTSVFILPLGNDLFKVGATYNWKDKTDLPTEEGKTELVERIQEIIGCDFEIVQHLPVVRPTVRDRRPLVGTHPELHRIHVLNGL